MNYKDVFIKQKILAIKSDVEYYSKEKNPLYLLHAFMKTRFLMNSIQNNNEKHSLYYNILELLFNKILKQLGAEESNLLGILKELRKKHMKLATEMLEINDAYQLIKDVAGYVLPIGPMDEGEILIENLDLDVSDKSFSEKIVTTKKERRNKAWEKIISALSTMGLILNTDKMHFYGEVSDCKTIMNYDDDIDIGEDESIVDDENKYMSIEQSMPFSEHYLWLRRIISDIEFNNEFINKAIISGSLSKDESAHIKYVEYVNALERQVMDEEECISYASYSIDNMVGKEDCYCHALDEQMLIEAIETVSFERIIVWPVPTQEEQKVLSLDLEHNFEHNNIFNKEYLVTEKDSDNYLLEFIDNMLPELKYLDWLNEINEITTEIAEPYILEEMNEYHTPVSYICVICEDAGCRYCEDCEFCEGEGCVICVCEFCEGEGCSYCDDEDDDYNC